MKTSRDAVRARELELEAEATDDRAIWAVTADAWEELGETKRAWYALLRSRGYGDSTVTRERAAEWQRRLRLADEEMERMARGLPIDLSHDDPEHGFRDYVLANEVRGRLELFLFMTEQPLHVFGYDRSGTSDVVTFAGDVLGRIVHRGKTRRPFGNGGRIASVRVAGVNGYTYNGTCAMENGTYCKLRRGKPWLR